MLDVRDVLRHNLRWSIVTELTSLAQSPEISIQHPSVGLASLAPI